VTTTPDQPQEPERGWEAPGGEQQAPREAENPAEEEQQYGRQQYEQQAQQQAPYQQYPYPQGGLQGAPPYGQTGQAGQYGQYDSAQYGGYQATPPPPPPAGYDYGYGYGGQPYGYPGGDLSPGMPPLADYGQRAGAFALDNGVAIVAGWITGATRSESVDLAFGLVGLAGIVWAVYNAVRAGRTGQSYGKRVMGIRLARLADGRPVGGGLGFFRLFFNWVLWLLCIVPGVLNLLAPLWDRRNQSWSDRIARSVVVKVPR